MKNFSTVKAKLNIISFLTIAGFSILIFLLSYSSQRQDQYSNTSKRLSELKISIIKLENISKQKIIIDNKFQNLYEITKKDLKKLDNSMKKSGIENHILKNFDKQLVTANNSYLSAYSKQDEIDGNLIKMNNAKVMINNIFSKVYDYKLLQYMMKLELYEKNFLLTKNINLKEVNKVQFKMRRSVRASENFTTNKPMQKQINESLIEYKNMLVMIVKEQKEIDKLQVTVKKEFNKTLVVLDKVDKIISNKIDEKIHNLLYIILSIVLIVVVLEFTITTFISKELIRNLKIVQVGLRSFFDVINYKADFANELVIDSKDEFGQIAKEINANIDSSVKLINHNKEVLEEANDILQKVANGFYGYKIPHHNNVSPDVKDLIININKMLDETKYKFDILNKALEAYGQYNFEYTVPKKDEKGLYGDFGTLVASTKLIGNNVSEFLAMILNTGDKLNNDTSILSHSSVELSNASNTQASSLEETSAALEEITVNIKNNTQNVNHMSNYATELSKASNEGKQLSIKTAISMDEINAQVCAISDAIKVIDQIAFQTNILSLNAAVEAATAGEAGKGFAVVAQEVRNLASRSAHAANEIKELVNKATIKTDEGKDIANNMNEGYEKLNNHIENTLTIINDVSKASKEQQEGIEQINSAITILDENTQINAQNAQHISNLSSSISSLSQSLITASSNAKFKAIVRKQVCDIDLVYKTAQLKNEHVSFKMENYAKVGTFEKWKVDSDHECNMGRWINECETSNLEFTNSTQWKELKQIHSNVHNSVQKYIDVNATRANNSILRDVAAEVESNTLFLFDKLNDIKILNCNNQES